MATRSRSRYRDPQQAANEQAQATPDTTADQEAAMRTVHDDWFTDDKTARIDAEAEWTEVDKLRRSQHWDLLGPSGEPLRALDEQANRPCLVDNVTLSLVEGVVAGVAQAVTSIQYATEPGDEAAARAMTELDEHVMVKNRLEVERLEFCRDFFWYGTAAWEVIWDPNWRGGRGPNRWEGDIRWRYLDIWQLFPDARCRRDLHDGNRVHKAKVATLEYIREHYSQYGGLVQADSTTVDYIAADGGSSPFMEASNRDTALLVETWYIGRPLLLEGDKRDQGTGLHVLWWAGEARPTYLGHANYVYYDPGATPRFPFVVRRRYPRAKPGIWGFGEAYYLKHQNIALNKYEELDIEGVMHHALGRVIFRPGALSEKQQKYAQENGTLPGLYLPADDPTGVTYWPGQGTPASLQSGQEQRKRSMESQVGRFDVTQGRTPGSVTAFAAMDLLNKQAKVRLQSADVAIQTAFEDCGALVNNLVVRYYTEQRTYRVVGKDSKQVPALKQFHANELKRVYLEDTNQVMPYADFAAQHTDPMTGELAPPEGLAYEVYSPEFDTVVKTSSALPSDRLVNLDMATKLLQYQLIDAQAVFHVLETGRFEPWEEIEQRMTQAKQAATAAAAQPAAQPVAVPPVGQINFSLSSKDPQVVLATLQEVMRQGAGAAPAPGQASAAAPPVGARGTLPPELVAELAALPPDEQEAILQEILDRAQGGGQNATQEGPQ